MTFVVCYYSDSTNSEGVPVESNPWLTLDHDSRGPQTRSVGWIEEHAACHACGGGCPRRRGHLQRMRSKTSYQCIERACTSSTVGVLQCPWGVGAPAARRRVGRASAATARCAPRARAPPRPPRRPGCLRVRAAQARRSAARPRARRRLRRPRRYRAAAARAARSRRVPPREPPRPRRRARSSRGRAA